VRGGVGHVGCRRRDSVGAAAAAGQRRWAAAIGGGGRCGTNRCTRPRAQRPPASWRGAGSRASPETDAGRCRFAAPDSDSTCTATGRKGSIPGSSDCHRRNATKTDVRTGGAERRANTHTQNVLCNEIEESVGGDQARGQLLAERGLAQHHHHIVAEIRPLVQHRTQRAQEPQRTARWTNTTDVRTEQQGA
jgi:hypothetical protein